MSIENVKGTHRDDRLDGDGEANLLKGLDGADIINGKDDSDTIIPNRPAMDINGDGMKQANTQTTNPNDPATSDGLDVIDGGDGIDTISYEGESESVTVNLGTIVPAIEDDETTEDNDEARISHVAAQVSGAQTVGDATTQGNTDRITVEDIGTEDDPDVVSTIENVTGGFGGDTLTGDARDNTLVGGAGDDTLSGGGGNDTLMGGAGADALTGGAGDDTLSGGPGTEATLDGMDGDDTYMGVEGGETVTEDANEGMDTVYYAAPPDDPGTEDTDESMNGIGTSGSAVGTPSNVETVFGTQNDDYLTAAAGAAVLGLGGDDVLSGNSDATADVVETLVGCAGENTLTGAAGNDVFGVYNDGDNADMITEFTTGATATATTDEIHLKGFEAGVTADPKLIPGVSDRAGIYVDGVLVARVASTDIDAIADNPATDAVETNWKSQAQAIVDALNKEGAVQVVAFDPDKCMSN